MIINKHIINILGQITNCPIENARLAGENEFWQAANHTASALLLIGQQGSYDRSRPIRCQRENHSKAREFYTATQLYFEF
jgi:hypothetical protein